MNGRKFDADKVYVLDLWMQIVQMKICVMGYDVKEFKDMRD